jgi:hypothetical protein
VAFTGEFYQWGPNHCVDIVITRTQAALRDHGEEVRTDSGVEVAYINFKGSNRRAILGAVLRDPNESRFEAAKECIMVKGFGVTKRSIESGRATLDNITESDEVAEREHYAKVKAYVDDIWQTVEDHPIQYQGYVDDPRNTDNSWSETCAFHIHLDKPPPSELGFMGKFTLLPDPQQATTQQWRSKWYFWMHAELAITCTARAREKSEQYRLANEGGSASRAQRAEISSNAREFELGWGPVHALGPWLHCVLVHSFASGYLSSISKSWCAFQLNPNDACGRDHCANVEASWSAGMSIGLLLAGAATWTRIRGSSTPPGWATRRGALGVQHWSSSFVFYCPMILVVLLAHISFDDELPVCDTDTGQCTSWWYIPINQSSASLSATTDAFAKFDCGGNRSARVSPTDLQTGEFTDDGSRAKREWRTMWWLSSLNGAAFGFSLAFFYAALMGRADVPERGRAVATAMAVVLFGSNMGALLGFRRSNLAPLYDDEASEGVHVSVSICVGALYLLVAGVLWIAEWRARGYNERVDRTPASHKNGSQTDDYKPETHFCPLLCGKKVRINRSKVALWANLVALLATGTAGVVVWAGGAAHGSLEARQQAPLAVLLLLLLSLGLSIWISVTRDVHAGPRRREAAITRAFEFLSAGGQAGGGGGGVGGGGGGGGGDTKP